MATTGNGAAVSWPAMSTAVSLLSRQQLCPEVSRNALLEGGDGAGPVLAAMEIIAAALTGLMFPDDMGGCFLELLGLAALKHGAEPAEGRSERGRQRRGRVGARVRRPASAFRAR